MPANTPGGFPYVLPTDHPLEFPSHSQALANKIDTTVDRALSVMAASGVRASPTSAQIVDLTTLQGKAGTLFTHNGTGIVCNFTGMVQITGRFQFTHAGGYYALSIAGDAAVTTGNVIKARGQNVVGTDIRGGVNVAGTDFVYNTEYLNSATITSLSAWLIVRPILP